jgi:hypothetical protein
VARVRRGAADRGERGEIAGAVAETLRLGLCRAFIQGLLTLLGQPAMFFDPFFSFCFGNKLAEKMVSVWPRQFDAPISFMRNRFQRCGHEIPRDPNDAPFRRNLQRMHCNKYTIFFDAGYEMGHAATFMRAASVARSASLTKDGRGGSPPGK